jgi:hypothetical protein
MKILPQFLVHGLASLVVLASVCRPSQAHAAEALTAFGGAGPGGVWFGNDNTVGWAFDALVPIRVTDLGLNSVYGSADHTLFQAHRIGIWDVGGNLLVSGVAGPGLGDTLLGAWEYAAVNPTTLGVGRYVIGAQYLVGSPEWVVAAPTTTDPAIQYVEARLGTGNDLPFPDQSFSSLFVGPNFQFTPVPEPSAIWLLLVASGGIVSFRIYRRRKDDARLTP